MVVDPSRPRRARQRAIAGTVELREPGDEAAHATPSGRTAVAQTAASQPRVRRSRARSRNGSLSSSSRKTTKHELGRVRVDRVANAGPAPAVGSSRASTAVTIVDNAAAQLLGKESRDRAGPD
jgi:hypothetical protein